jgi:hypothetical protein
MSYRYDAFFSYKRNPQSNDWHEKVKEKLEFWLGQELNCTNVSIFIDNEDIRSGDRWRGKLGDALRSSKCLICIWSPFYFQSKWCVSEWQTFLRREPWAGGKSLVVPARYHDGETYPELAQDTQSADFTPFASTIPAFWETTRAVEFEQPYLQKFAQDIAACVRNAPPYDEAFPLVEASEELLLKHTTIRRPGDSVA